LADYPRFSIEAETAKQRLIDFMKVIYSITFFVNRMENMKKAWQSKLYMAHTMNELISWNHLIIAGKSKLINCLSLVRQIHDYQYSIPNSFEWLTSKNFYDDYDLFKRDISDAMAKKDNIDIQDAEETAKEVFWYYMQRMLAFDYKVYLAQRYPSKHKDKKNVRATIGKLLPVVKKVYRNYVRPIFNKELQLHYEVLQPSSKYYKDFKPVMDSFTGSSLKNL
jgi:hypothetical protein